MLNAGGTIVKNINVQFITYLCIIKYSFSIENLGMNLV